MSFRTITLGDYELLYMFWKDNYFVTEADTREHFEEFLNKNPELSILMEDEEGILGCALGSYDGRRGYLQKVVVQKSKRHEGIGKQLVEEALKRLREAGAVFVPISVEPEFVDFYKSCGFKITDQTSMTTDLVAGS